MTDRWLLTYSDMITLLLTLFIVLYSMSNIDLEKFKQMAQNLGSSFNNEAVEILQQEAVSASEGTGGDTQDTLTAVYEELKQYVQENDLENMIDLEKTDTYVKITLTDRVMFYPDSSVMLGDFKPIIAKISQAIERVYSGVDQITVSGHTATMTGDLTTSNDIAWKLSADRAVTVVNALVDSGLEEPKLSIEGRSHFSPIAPNDTEENRAKNRRVEILILKEQATESTNTDTADTEDASTSE